MKVYISAVAPTCRHILAASHLKDLPNLSIPTTAVDDWFDPTSVFGPRGFRHMTKAAQYVLASAASCVDHMSLENDELAVADGAVVIGTNFAIYEPVLQLDRTVRNEGAHLIRPTVTPNFSVNIPASVVSIKHGFRALNVTLTTPVTAGLDAVMQGAKYIVNGRANFAIVGAAEDSTPVELTSEPHGLFGADGGACLLGLKRLPREAQDREVNYPVINAAQQWHLPLDEGSASRQAMKDKISRSLLPLFNDLELNHGSGYIALGWGPVSDLIDESLMTHGIQRLTDVEKFLAPTYFTLPPVLAVGHLALARKDGVVIATSESGHLAAISIKSST